MLLKPLKRTHLIVIDINGFQFDKKSPKRDAFDSLMLILGEVMQYDPDFLSRSFGLIGKDRKLI